MTENTKTENVGRHLLDASDFVAVVDVDKNEVGAVPKHWGPDQIAAGLTKTNRKPKGQVAATQSARDVDAEVAKAREADAARIAALEAELEAATKDGQGAKS